MASDQDPSQMGRLRLRWVGFVPDGLDLDPARVGSDLDPLEMWLDPDPL